MAKHKKQPIESTSFNYDAQIRNWDKTETVLNGTQALRDAAKLYLPRYAGESPKNYTNRLERSFFKNFFTKTLNAMVGHPFSKPIQKEDWKTEFDDFFDDVDLMGNNLDIFAKKTFTTGIAKGLVYILVDFPNVEANADGSTLTKEDEERLNLRPYFNVLAPEAIFFIQSQMVNGIEVPIHVRIREDVFIQEGFEQVIKHRIRILEPGTFEVFERNAKGDWPSIASGTTTLDEIPLVIFYLDKQGFGHSRTPLNDLADLNIAHWQSMSDQRNILTVARFPILTGIGISNEEKDNVIIGPFNMLTTNQPDAEFKYLEHTGNAIESGRKDIQDLERTLETIIVDFLTKQPGNQTATAKSIDTAKSQSLLQTWTLQFQDFLDSAMLFVAKWKNLEPDTNGTLTINTEFGIIGNNEDLKLLQESRRSGDISRKALLTEYKRRNILMEEYDIDEDMEEILNESIPPVDAGDTEPGGEDDDDDNNSEEDNENE